MRITTLFVALGLASISAACTSAASCPVDAGTGTPDGEGVDAAMCVPVNLIRPRANPIEYVGMAITRPIATNAEFLALVDPIFGAAAQGGMGHHDYPLQTGVLLSSITDSRTPDQAVVTLDMMPPGPTSVSRRTILQVPASYAYGKIFIDTVAAALARKDIVNAGSPLSMEPFELDYDVRSVNGGFLEIRVVYTIDGHTTVTLDTHNPETSLTPGQVNMPAFTGDPYETVGGTVWFGLSRDEFSFFSGRAYGVTSGAAQNFQDFHLLPHDWLRLTVTPRLADRVVDVAFEVITLDGRRVPIAASPASFIASEQFQQSVFRMIDNMNAAEAVAPGSSQPWQVPYYYDDPQGGGVVRVVAQGQAGVFKIAYVVVSPTHTLQDVAYVPYTATIHVPDHLPPTSISCTDIGAMDALHGHFRVTFNASDTVRTSPSLTLPLMGTVRGEIFHSSDVTIMGPNPGAHSVAYFEFPNVDVRDPAGSIEYDVPDDLAAGDYQILASMDIDGNADPLNPSPDEGDPVTLPIGGYTLKCDVQPVVVEFALLLPAGAI